MNNKGRATGITLILLLVVALIVAFLAMQSLTSLRPAGIAPNAQPQSADQAPADQPLSPVDQARQVVDQLNQAQQRVGEGM